MLATLSRELPRHDERWAYEVKWDGMRAIATIDRGSLRITTRNLNDVTAQYPELHALVDHLDGHDAILDGEIVVFDDDGRPSFERLQTRFGLTATATIRTRSVSTPACYVVFDILRLDETDLTGDAYERRRALLRELVADAAHWRVPAHRTGGGAAMLDAVDELGLEGIVAKRLGSAYQPGRRSSDWRKVKLHRRQEFVVGGWTHGAGRRADSIGALLLGWHDEAGRLVYAGSVGTGFSDLQLASLARTLVELRVDASPFDVGGPERPSAAQWAEPRLVCEVAYAELTSSGTLRHPTFLGLRIDKDPRSVVREEAGRRRRS